MSSYVDLDSPELEGVGVFPWLQNQTAPIAAGDATYPKIKEISSLRPLIAEANNRLKFADDPFALAAGKKGANAAFLKDREFAPLKLAATAKPPQETKPKIAKNLFSLAASDAKEKEKPALSSAGASAPADADRKAEPLPEKVALAAAKTETVSKAVIKKKDPYACDYNLDLILLKDLFLPADQRTYNKSMGHIKTGKEIYAKLDEITRLSRILRDLNKEHPKEIDLSKNPVALSLIDKMREYGLVESPKAKEDVKEGEEKKGEEKPKTVFSERDMEVLIANLETESKILPNKAQIEFTFVGPLREQASQVMRIVSKALELDQKLVERALSRIRGG